MQEAQDGGLQGAGAAPDPQAGRVLLRPEILTGVLTPFNSVELKHQFNKNCVELRSQLWSSPELLLTPTSHLCFLQGESAFSLVVRGTSGGVLLAFTKTPIWEVPFKFQSVYLATIDTITSEADLKLIDLVPLLLPFLP